MLNNFSFSHVSKNNKGTKTEDSKLKDDLIEDKEPKTPKPEEKKEEKSQGTGGGPGGSGGGGGGGVIIPCNLNCPYILWPNPDA